MALTPSTIRKDKKCGASGIADNKKCRKNPLGAPFGRLRDAQRTNERRYGKPRSLTKTQKIKALGIAALAAGVGVGLGALASKSRQTASRNIPDVKNIKPPAPKNLQINGSAADLEKIATKGRFKQTEALARGTNPELEAHMQVKKARNEQAKKELKSMKGDLQRLRSELGVWGPNRIKPFKRSKNDSIWAEGFAP